MAFVVGREFFYPLAETYQGPTATIQLEFPFFFAPFIDPLSQLEPLVKLALVSADITNLVKENYLAYRLAVEARPNAIDRYQVTVIVAGETQPASGTIRAGVPGSNIRVPGVRHVGARAAVPTAFIPFLAIIAIGIALSLLLLTAGITYNIVSGKWGVGAAVGFLLPFAALAGGVALVGYALYGPKRQQQPGRR